MVLRKHKTWCASLCHTLDDMRQSSGFSDVIIRADNGHVFTAHACVLAAASPVLKTQLLASHHYLDMPNISRHMWEVVLQFIYTGNLKIENTSEIPSILETCELLELTGLITLCKDLLMDNKQEGKHVAKTHSVSHKVATRSQARMKRDIEELPTENDPVLPVMAESGSGTLGDPEKEKSEGHTVYVQIENVDDTLSLGAQEMTTVAKNDAQNIKIEPAGLLTTVSDDDVMADDECEHDGSTSNSENDISQSTAGSLKSAETHDDMVVTCGFCGKGFRKHEYLREHMNLHLGERPYECSICGQAFVYRSNFNRHKLVHKDVKPHKCPVCEKSFRRPSDLACHRQRIHSHEKPYLCPLCGKAFATRSAVSKHKHTHRLDRPFMCDICDKTFTTMSTLLSHRRSHTNERPFCCEVCGKAFKDQSNLSRHRHTHTNNKRHQCVTCGKAFLRKSDLADHERSHDGLKPFACDVCGKAFGVRSNLAKHKPIHDDVKRHQCGICGKRFAKRCSLVSHQRIHFDERPFQCTVCEKTFKEKANMKRHFRLHSNEKEHKCPVCNKGFNRRSDMLRHEVTRHTSKPYRCLDCGRGYVSQLALDRHACAKYPDLSLLKSEID